MSKQWTPTDREAWREEKRHLKPGHREAVQLSRAASALVLSITGRTYESASDSKPPTTKECLVMIRQLCDAVEERCGLPRAPVRRTEKGME